MRTLATDLYWLVVFVLYPLWLAAGAVDYVCHRRTDIERTSGQHESALHVLQYASVALVVIGATLFTVTSAILWLVAVLVAGHTVLAYVDLRYTIPRRHISALEQLAHAVLIIVPVTAVIVLALVDWHTGALEERFERRTLEAWRLALLIGAGVVGAGAPVMEEYFRTRRSASINSRTPVHSAR